MTRLTITPCSLPSKYPSLPITADSLDVAFTNAGASYADGAGFAMTGKEILIALNGAATAKTVTISSVADAYNRTGDITSYSIGAGEYALFPQFQLDGWMQSDGMLHFAANDTAVAFLVLRLKD